MGHADDLARPSGEAGVGGNADDRRRANHPGPFVVAVEIGKAIG
jgi:hypothetical protein